MYDLLEKKQRRGLILGFAKIKNEDEFVLMDEKDLFRSVEYLYPSAPPSENVSIIIAKENDSLVHYPQHEDPALEGIISPNNRRVGEQMPF